MYILIQYLLCMCACVRVYRWHENLRVPRWSPTFLGVIRQATVFFSARTGPTRKRASNRVQGRLSLLGPIFGIIFTLYHIIRVSDKTIFSFKYLIPQKKKTPVFGIIRKDPTSEFGPLFFFFFKGPHSGAQLIQHNVVPVLKSRTNVYGNRLPGRTGG